MEQASQHTKKSWHKLKQFLISFHESLSEAIQQGYVSLWLGGRYSTLGFISYSTPNPESSSNILKATHFSLPLSKNLPCKNDYGIKWQSASLSHRSLSLNSEFSCNYESEDLLVLSGRGRRAEQGFVQTLLSLVEAAPPCVRVQQVHLIVAVQVNSDLNKVPQLHVTA